MVVTVESSLMVLAWDDVLQFDTSFVALLPAYRADAKEPLLVAMEPLKYMLKSLTSGDGYLGSLIWGSSSTWSTP